MQTESPTPETALQGNAREPEDLKRIVEASMEGWRVFILTGLDSDFYREARSRCNAAEDAAAVTLLHLYLMSFTAEERERLLADMDVFLHYAHGFLRELYPPRAQTPEFRRLTRQVFMRSMKQIAAEERRVGPTALADAHCFMRAMFRISRSLDAITAAWNDYRRLRPA